MSEEVKEKLYKYTNDGSGWQLTRVIKLMVNLVSYKPQSGDSYIKLPLHLEKKKAIINIQNKDNECFKWSVARALNLVDDNGHPERLTLELRKESKKYNWNDLTFPVNLHDIKKFEKNNEDISVNVFGVDINNTVYPLRIYDESTSGKDRKNKVNLLLYEKDGIRHYCVIKEMNRLLRSQITNSHC